MLNKCTAKKYPTTLTNDNQTENQSKDSPLNAAPVLCYDQRKQGACIACDKYQTSNNK